MSRRDIVEKNRVRRATRVLKEGFGVLFYRAPVMMHSIDKDGRIIRVNGRWLQTLGYEAGEVLGKKSTEFLTEESRARAVKDTLPLFWRVGSARSVGYRYITKDGRILDLLLSAEVMPLTARTVCSYATLHNVDDPIQWE